jgi:hypothetical protein
METNVVDHVSQAVYRQFPELRGVRPSVRKSGDQFLLIFSGKVKTADGKTLPRIVRVTANDQGSILKMTTSR